MRKWDFLTKKEEIIDTPQSLYNWRKGLEIEHDSMLFSENLWLSGFRQLNVFLDIYGLHCPEDEFDDELMWGIVFYLADTCVDEKDKWTLEASWDSLLLQVSLVKATLTTINTLIPTLTTEQTPILLNFIKTLTEQFDLLSKSIDSLKEKQQEKPYGYFSGAAKLNTISAEELERERSIVVTGLTESAKKLPSEKMADDSIAITSLLDSVGVECAPRFFYRMGRLSNPPNNGHARLLKIVLPSRKFQRELLKKWKTTGKKSFPQINMRESMTPEQLQRRKELIEECKRKRMENPQLDWIVYGEAVILRSE
uniref:Uncharacterized protein n=1 Tax=Meloidogyne javanica TaxID=6303 RepID=A0A915ML02_MELJA